MEMAGDSIRASSTCNCYLRSSVFLSCLHNSILPGNGLMPEKMFPRSTFDVLLNWNPGTAESQDKFRVLAVPLRRLSRFFV